MSEEATKLEVDEIRSIVLDLSSQLAELHRQRCLELFDRMRTDFQARETLAISGVGAMLREETTIIREIYLLVIVLTAACVVGGWQLASILVQAAGFLVLSIITVRIYRRRRARLLEQEAFWKKRSDEVGTLYRSMLFNNQAKGAKWNQRQSQIRTH